MPAISASTLFHARVMLAGTAVSTALGGPRALVLVAFPAFVYKAWRERDQWPPRGFGMANAITACRLLLTAAIGFASGSAGWWLCGACLLIFALDGIDGKVARRRGESSEFGAGFDLEVDAFFVAVMGFVLWDRGVAAWWCLVPGLLRYLYVLVVARLPDRPHEPRSFISRVAYSVLVSCFTAAFVVPPAAATAVTALGTLTLCWSFGRSFWWSLVASRNARSS